MTVHMFPRRQIALPSTHAVAIALDEYLALTGHKTAMFQSPALESAHCVELVSFDLGTGQYRDAPPALCQLARLRLEAAEEIERLIALLDFLDGDPDLEPYLAGFHGRYTSDGEVDDSDDEPSLGASEAYGGGITDWRVNVGEQADECEPDHDAEPDFALIHGGTTA